jgi:hypothetical protein
MMEKARDHLYQIMEIIRAEAISVVVVAELVGGNTIRWVLVPLRLHGRRRFVLDPHSTHQHPEWRMWKMVWLGVREPVRKKKRA